MLGTATVLPLAPLLTTAGCVPARRNADAGAVVIQPGIQLYTLREAAARDLDGTLEALAAMGYREVELAGLYNRSPRAFRDALDQAGLRAPSSHVPLERLRAPALEATLDEAEALGHAFLVVPWLDRAEYPTSAHWRRLADELARIGQRVRSRGLKLAYHNHDFPLRPLADGVVPYDILLGIDSSLLRMEMDVFWLIQGGGDPLEYFAKYPRRFDMIHVKDRGRDGSQVDVGEGMIDFAAIYAHASQAGFTHAFVEHDDPADAFAFARNAATHLRTLRTR